MRLVFTKIFQKDVWRLKNKLVLKQLKNFLLILKEIQTLWKLGNIKPIKWAKGFYRARIWRYRLWFKLENVEIILLRFLPRKDIYKYFP
jgi:mRNA interferase RelE/StbE